MSHFDTLLTRVHELDDLGKAGAVLYWDREVNMPHAGLAERIAQMTTLSSPVSYTHLDVYKRQSQRNTGG